MDYTQVLQEIKKGLIRPVYLLHGEETFLARQVQKAVIEAVLPPDERDIRLEVFDRDPSAAELGALVDTVPFMGGKKVIVVRGTGLFRSGRKGSADGSENGRDSADERFVKLLADMPDYTHLVFTTPEKADKRRKIYKAVEQNGAVVEFNPLKPRDVRPWIQSRLTALGRKMDAEAQDYLLAAVSMMPQISLGFLDNELEKAALYTGSRVITRHDLAAVMSAVPEVSVFAMIEAVSQKHVAEALGLLEEQFSAGENAIRLLALLVRQVRLLWRSRELADRGLNGGQVAAQLGVPPFVGEKLVRQSRLFPADKLRKTIVELAEAEYCLKSGRTDKFILEKIIIDFCK